MNLEQEEEELENKKILMRQKIEEQKRQQYDLDCNLSHISEKNESDS